MVGAAEFTTVPQSCYLAGIEVIGGAGGIGRPDGPTVADPRNWSLATCAGPLSPNGWGWPTSTTYWATAPA